MSPAILKNRIYLETAAAVLTRRASEPARVARVHRLVEALHRDPALTPQPPQSLEEISGDDVDPQRFQATTRGCRRPIVIRGFARESRAVQGWSAEHLKQRLSGAQCHAIRHGSQADFSLGNTPPEEMSFVDFIDRMSQERIYLNNCTELFCADPALVSELELPEIRRRLLKNGPLEDLVTTQFFIGARHVFSRMHCAPAGNVFLQVAGRKRWTLIDPAYTAHLLPIPAQPFQYAVSGLGGFRKRREHGMPTDILEHLPRYEVVLEPGDVLYNAPWWWHEVENLDDFTVGCAIRHVTSPTRISANWHNHALLTALSIYPRARALLLVAQVARRLVSAEESLLMMLNRRTTERLHHSFQHRSRAEAQR